MYCKGVGRATKSRKTNRRKTICSPSQRRCRRQNRGSFTPSFADGHATLMYFDPLVVDRFQRRRRGTSPSPRRLISTKKGPSQPGRRLGQRIVRWLPTRRLRRCVCMMESVFRWSSFRTPRKRTDKKDRRQRKGDPYCFLPPIANRNCTRSYSCPFSPPPTTIKRTIYVTLCILCSIVFFSQEVSEAVSYYARYHASWQP